MDRPNWDCTCRRFVLSKHCRHVFEIWNELNGFTQANIVHHDEIARKPWMKNKQLT